MLHILILLKLGITRCLRQGAPIDVEIHLCLIAAGAAGNLNNTFQAHVRAVAHHVQAGKEIVHLPWHVGEPTASDSRELGHLMF